MTSHSPNIELWLKLRNADGVGPVTFSALYRHFGSIERTLSALMTELTKIEGIGSKTAEQIVRSREKFNAKAEIELADKLNVSIINLDDHRYPPALKSIYDAPPVLYVKGAFSRQDAMSIAIVGSRRSSFYGQEQAGRFAHLLASSGFTIVSGMARGIDTSAQKAHLPQRQELLPSRDVDFLLFSRPKIKNYLKRLPQMGPASANCLCNTSLGLKIFHLETGSLPGCRLV